MIKAPSSSSSRRVPKTVSAPAGTVAVSGGRASAALPVKRAARKIKGQVSAAIPAAEVKPAKAHKPKLIRDSFTIPKDEYQVLSALKGRALGLELHVRKSELLRAGIQALHAMNDRAFLAAIAGVPTLKTGRPKAD